MADKIEARPGDAPQRPISVNLVDPAKRAYWAGCLGVSEEKLRSVVATVGPLAKDIRHFLGSS